MTWVIVVVAMLVLAAAAWAGTGRLGQMPEPVTDRPKGRIPAGPIDEQFIATALIPTALNGYQRSQVDAYLRAWVDAKMPVEASFDVVPGGYDMQAVDAILDRAAQPWSPAQASRSAPDPHETAEAPYRPAPQEDAVSQRATTPAGADRAGQPSPTETQSGQGPVESGIDTPDAE
ncbi:MAG: hypothetical protein ACK5KO_04395 [Arachnia sp.]